MRSASVVSSCSRSLGSDSTLPASSLCSKRTRRAGVILWPFSSSANRELDMGHGDRARRSRNNAFLTQRRTGAQAQRDSSSLMFSWARRSIGTVTLWFNGNVAKSSQEFRNSGKDPLAPVVRRGLLFSCPSCVPACFVGRSRSTGVAPFEPAPRSTRENQRGGAATNLPPRAISHQLSAVSWWSSAPRSKFHAGPDTGASPDQSHGYADVLVAVRCCFGCGEVPLG